MDLQAAEGKRQRMRGGVWAECEGMKSRGRSGWSETADGFSWSAHGHYHALPEQTTWQTASGTSQQAPHVAMLTEEL